MNRRKFIGCTSKVHKPYIKEEGVGKVLEQPVSKSLDGVSLIHTDESDDTDRRILVRLELGTCNLNRMDFLSKLSDTEFSYFLSLIDIHYVKRDSTGFRSWIANSDVYYVDENTPDEYIKDIPLEHKAVIDIGGKVYGFMNVTLNKHCSTSEDYIVTVLGGNSRTVRLLGKDINLPVVSIRDYRPQETPRDKEVERRTLLLEKFDFFSEGTESAIKSTFSKIHTDKDFKEPLYSLYGKGRDELNNFIYEATRKEPNCLFRVFNRGGGNPEFARLARIDYSGNLYFQLMSPRVSNHIHPERRVKYEYVGLEHNHIDDNTVYDESM